jgi:hypothetical protein
LTTALAAEPVAAGVLRVERRYPLPHRHGCVVLDASPLTLDEVVGAQMGSPAGWLFLDTETSGLAGGTGTWAFLCGIARIDAREVLVRQYLLTRLDAEPVYLDLLETELRSAGALVTYNGKAFDVPLLMTRFRLAGLRVALDAVAHADLLFAVRRAFGRVWPDCRLATAEARLLCFQRQGDLAGADAPRAWLAWLRQGAVAPLAGVLNHNRRDLLSLPALIQALRQVFQDPAGAGADVLALAGVHRRRGDLARAIETLTANRGALAVDGLLELARLHRRRGDWEAALAIWEPLATRGVLQAIDALAKYLEHQARDHRRALAMAERLPPGPARDRRRRRLEGRLYRQTGESSRCRGGASRTGR